MKRLLILLYILLVTVMAAATIYEKYQGTDQTHLHIYGAWWFTALWALTAAVGVAYFVSCRIRRASTVLLHLSMVVILSGALLTHLWSWQGIVHLRINDTCDTYMVRDSDAPGGVAERPLPFRMRLMDFQVKYHEGTEAAADYESELAILPLRSEVSDEHEERARTINGSVSMNRILTHAGIRITQMSYDPDMRGSNLQLNSDPWGIPVTYTGYALLFVSLFWMLLDPRGAYRRLLRSPLLRRGVIAWALILSPLATVGPQARAATTVSEEMGRSFGQLLISYNGRICPVQTYAIDFTRKLYGKTSYGGYTAEQVLLGFLFYGQEWASEPIIRVKDGPIRRELHLPDHCSFNTFFSHDQGGYLLGPLVQEYYGGHKDKRHEQAAQLDDRLMLITELGHGTPLALFPARGTKQPRGMMTPRAVMPQAASRQLNWFSPADDLPASVPADEQQFVRGIFTLLYEKAVSRDEAGWGHIVGKIRTYQLQRGGRSLPTPLQLRAEGINNRVPFATLLFIVCLTMGILMLVRHIRGMIRAASPLPQPSRRYRHYTSAIPVVIMTLALLTLTVALALRWIISGKIPMANGYESMLTMAWIIMVVTLALTRRFRIVLTLGYLMAGFLLLVSHIGQMDPAITPVMPVLNSPLLSLHVGIIMTAYALLALTFIIGITALVLRLLSHTPRTYSQLEALQALSQLFLYPALVALSLGIFIGALWANISWGQYWSWDPKETWALITLLVYAAAVHIRTLPGLRRPTTYHLYLSLAFLSILMTYFGVNYVLGGMHSYA